ncbi:MAG TPA: helicase-exonuclease AddAB subunit AddB [Eubacterium sp.]|nr:helicase-exonuclease AddAB subunit AddB [Eubacterium sp.]
MSLQYIFGGSGAGKSTYLYNSIIKESIKNPLENYIIVVPEQYTMATQKRVVELHPRKGVLNIDVVSFERLAYKVFEEVGAADYPILDDTGKNLIVRRVLEQNKKALRFFGSNISNTGFVSELKSVISEMLQYDISVDKLLDINKNVDNKSLLGMKLDDISLIYGGFKEFIKNNYITSEEILDLMCRKVTESSKIRGSVIAFDGFTGFTPVQYRLMAILLDMCKEVKVALTIDISEHVNINEGIESLFYMTKDTVAHLNRICDEGHINVDKVTVGEDIVLTRFAASKELAFLEKNIFRPGLRYYSGKVNDIVMYAGITPKDEIQYVSGEILKLTRLQGFRYNEIAVVTGDISVYGKLAANIFAQNDIPYFLDQKLHVTDNCLVEMITAVLDVIEKNYTYDSMFRYLRTGLTGLSDENIDILDNYCLAVGIKGRKQWSTQWCRKFRSSGITTDLNMLNELRLKVMEPLTELDKELKEADGNVRLMTTALYKFLVGLHCEEQMSLLAKSHGDEYRQIYKKIMELFDKIVHLLGSEKVSVKEYNRIMASGFDEIKIGLIPPTKDCVVIGDIERTRLDNIKAMFFIGVNDGYVPKKSDSRSVLSETDRQKLKEMEVSLSMSVREKAFVQRFYLYLIMTKTSGRLYITYAYNSMDMKAILPSYIVRMLKKMFPGMNVLSYDDTAKEHSYIKIPKTELEWTDENLAKILADGVALKLYGKELTGSVTSFEQFASCQYAYFCRYGLDLSEREEYRFAVNDFGTILHAVIEDVSKNIKRNKKSFVLLSDEERRSLVSESIHAVADNYGNTILKSTSRNEYLIKRMEDLADKTLWAIGKQLADGLFTPDTFEKGFLTRIEDLPHDVSFFMQGKIDRIDICEDDENVYVKVVDYKTGHADFDLFKTYYGLKIQLFTYMREAIAYQKKKHEGKNVIPAGLLYYNIDNPIVETKQTDDSAIEELIRKELRMKGVVNSNKNIISKLDSTEGTSLNIPVTVGKSGNIDASKSKVLTTEELLAVGRYVDKENLDKATKILDGSIHINPYEKGNENSCAYCPYNSVCGFSEDMPGVKFRRLEYMSPDDIWAQIKGNEEK